MTIEKPESLTKKNEVIKIKMLDQTEFWNWRLTGESPLTPTDSEVSVYDLEQKDVTYQHEQALLICFLV